MKHYFIINPIAGRNDSTEYITQEVERIFENRKEEYVVYITHKICDATDYVSKICMENEKSESPEDIVFYACGGDGSCFEVLNGLAGYKHALFTVVPVGSCNDFLKSFPEYDFSNLEDLVNGVEKQIDIIKINEYYSLNVCNIGFDSKVNYDCVANRKKYKTIKQAYNAAIIKNILKPWNDKVEIAMDSKVIFKGKLLLSAFANGNYYGGGYHCAPLAKVDDGLIDACIIKKVSRITFASLIKYFKDGTLLNKKQAKNIVTYKKGRKISITSDKTLTVTIDGESFFWKNIDINVVTKGLRFILPNKKIEKQVNC